MKDKFKDVMEAYDVLSDEERRGSWERLRENMKSGGASEAAVRQMTPEEALAYMRGLRELAQIKRQGYKRTKKAPPIEQEVRLRCVALRRVRERRCVCGVWASCCVRTTYSTWTRDIVLAPHSVPVD